MIYVIKKGDTLSRIAREFGTSAARLRSDNGLLADQPLVPGQALVVLIPDRTYTVRPGDGLYRISSQTGVPVRELIRLNPTLVQTGTVRAEEVLTLSLQGEGENLGPFRINGYAYPHIRPGVLRQAMPFLTELSIFSYGFREDGTLVPTPDRWLLEEAARFGADPSMVLTSIDENGQFSTTRAARLFQDQSLQDVILDNILTVMKEKGYRILDSDFEFIRGEDAQAYFSFLRHARDRLHAKGSRLHVDLAPKTYANQPGLLYEAHDYTVIGEIADQVLLMTYEWGYAYGPPMAVAPLPQVERVLRYGVSEIPTEKIQMGIPNYGYDWILPYEKERRATTVGNQEAVLLASRMGAAIRFDETARAPTFQYRQDGVLHEVWFEDARSMQAKIRLADALGLGGLGIWNLLRPFAQNWAWFSENLRF
ncbi:MAG: LysM peptidoglycan-binding domain-containing protein [Ruminiclostridium sp.]|nr:LysM peptidoglycan-binding domain-containing protein [Ruminiclostridium sp.]